MRSHIYYLLQLFRIKVSNMHSFVDVLVECTIDILLAFSPLVFLTLDTVWDSDVCYNWLNA